MQTFVPNYYDKFSCIASACKHSCCIGWEIDVDEDTLDYYKTVGGELGKRLSANISTDGEQPHFILGENERCPFLNKNGLCDIITECGEASLCQICADHPRFRSFFSDRTEVGLGLCCEAAADLILHHKQSFSLIKKDDDGEDDELWAEDEALLAQRSLALEIAQNRSLSFEQRVENLLDKFTAIVPDKPPKHWAEFFSELERLDNEWDNCLNKLGESERIKASIDDETAAENLLCYFIYRHMPAALDDGDVKSKIAFAVLSCRIIFTVAQSIPLEEAARMYSSEVEYSVDNLNAVYNAFI